MDITTPAQWQEEIGKKLLKAFGVTHEISDTDYQNLAKGVRIAVLAALKKPNPHLCIITEYLYKKYVRSYKAEIIKFLPFSYLGYTHKHPDRYVHFGPIKTLKKIIEDGYLISSPANEDATVGEAVYTYPLRSMMYFYQDRKDYGFLVFEADVPHVHIVQTDDGIFGLGEADFFEEKVWIENPVLITSVEEMERLSEKEFWWEKAQTHYYGLPYNCDLQKPENTEQLLDILEWFNQNCLSAKPDLAKNKETERKEVWFH